MYNNQAWYFRAQQTFPEGGEQVIQFLYDEIHRFCIFTLALSFPQWFVSEKPAQAGNLPSPQAPGIVLPASGHAPSQNTNDMGWHIWESKKWLQSRPEDSRQEPHFQQEQILFILANRTEYIK